MTITPFDPYALEEKSQQQFQAALDGLSPAQRSTLLDALAQVEQPVVQEWLDAELLQEWVQQGLHVCKTVGERGATLSNAMFAATPALLRVLTRPEMSEWIRFLL
ncbi:MAG: hypothetical protein ACE1Y4_10940, partial [Lysobacterales bacterium]